MILKRLLLAASMLCISTTSFAQDSKTSTPAERAHWVEVLHKLEVNPDDQPTILDAEGVVKRLIEVSDFHLSLCDVFGELPKDYGRKEPISQLFLLGLAGYQVETGKSDSDGANLYALHSVLKGYAVILQHDPKAKNKKLDELAKQGAEGKLPALISKKGCK